MTRAYRGLQGVRKLKGVTGGEEGYKGLEEFTMGYRG